MNKRDNKQPNVNNLNKFKLMRIFTLLSFAALLGAQSVNAQAPVQNQKLYPSLENTSAMFVPAKNAVAKEAAKSIMRPAKEEIYYRNDAQTDWMAKPATTYTYTYDEKGRVKTKLYYNPDNEIANQKYERYSYEYDEKGNCTLELLEYSGDGETWKGSVKNVMTYDNVVDGLLTSTMQYEYSTVTKDLTKMVPENCMRKDITRDEKGRVTQTTVYRWKDKKTEYVYQRINPTYDETTGHPSSIMVEDQIYDSATDSYNLGEDKKFSNLKWLECNDQFVNVSDNFRSGASRATEYTFGYRGHDYGDYKMTYGEKAPEYEATYTYLDGSGGDEMSCKLLDENGSFYIYDKSWWDKNGDKEETKDEIALSKYTYYYTEKGVRCGEEQWGGGYGDDLTLYYAHKDDYKYDAEYDYQTEIIAYTWDFSNPVLADGSVNFKASQRTVYSEFSSVGEVDAIDGAKVSTEGFTSYSLFDLQGRCVEKGAMNANIGNGKHGVFVLQMTNGSETKSVRIAR